MSNKNLVTSIITLTLLFTLTLPLSTAHATSTDQFQITRIRGEVKGPDGKPLNKALVTVLCDGETKTDKTGRNGKYSVIFVGKNVCEAGQIATITVVKDDLTGSGQGTVQNRRDGRYVDRNILVINVASVPEFGLVTGALAAIIPGVAYLRLRRKS